MIGYCPSCEQYNNDNTVKNGDGYVGYEVCRDCGFEIEFKRLPLFVLVGANGTGKTTVMKSLIGRLTSVIAFESDCLWNRYSSEENLWDRICFYTGQNGMPCLVAGHFGPDAFRGEYYYQIHHMLLTCKTEELKRRLLSRPQWRRTCDPEELKRLIEYNENILPAWGDEYTNLTVIDTTDGDLNQYVRQIETQIRDALTHSG